ncbi:iron chaperone [Alkalibacterium thalassium]|uniref:Uncharacterized conserved protein YdhG, YjbR/CyaY-like superfamily, DUF1801 family n=1 Tax=Alkalibacterium thalassium TaxID=426701 RepID=A0A1G9A610_9LACT|nr:DUF1801 domain-containing protein [Alkalibacterium thalassium]SDK22733.1 Uncharacterized conserved protein YdhG, YjbR/CyaY-like superfamily, DUF1801 family [Alkalibacterium thalassium]
MPDQDMESNVREYINSQPEKVRIRLLRIRDLVYQAVPEAIEVWNYNLPSYALVEGGKRDKQIMMAGYRSHIGFYPHPSVISHFSADLKGLKTGKGSVQFPLNQPLPEQLILDMITYRKHMIDELQDK